MIYIIRTMFGDEVGREYNIHSAKRRCADLLSENEGSLAVIIEGTSHTVGWMLNGWNGRKGLFWENSLGQVSVYEEENE